MSRIRLQIQVMPWNQKPGLSPAFQARQGEVDKFCLPCDENCSIQELADQIYIRWARANPSIGLNIRHLESYFGDILDMNDNVGAIFDDRKPGPNGQLNETSVVKVFRYPPTPTELHTSQRFASLMPESTARPLKRLPPPFLQNSQVDQGYEGGEEQWRPPNETLETASKRRRLHEEAYNPDQPIMSGEERANGLNYSSHPSGIEQLRAQVADSQRSPRKKHTDPYGTPASLYLLSSQERIPGDQHDSEIPDSPTDRITSGAHRTTVEEDKRNTKSESPELGGSSNSMPSKERLPPTKQTYIDVPASDPSTNPPIATPVTSIQDTVGQSLDDCSVSIGSNMPQGAESTTTPIETSSKRRHSSVDATFAATRQHFDGLLRSSELLDPIESEGENFCHQEAGQNNKRRKLDLGKASTNAPTSAGAQGSDRKFLVPALPESRANEAQVPRSEISTPALDGISPPAGEAENGEMHRPSSHQRSDKQAPETGEIELLTPKVTNHGRSERTRVDLRNQRLASGTQEPEHTRSVDNKVEQRRRSDEATNTQRTAEAEESEARRKAQRESAERKAEEDRLAEERAEREETDRAEKLAEIERARQIKAEEKAAEADAIKKAREKEQEIAREKDAIERIAREQRVRERELKKQAEKTTQAAEGAKHLEAEKLKKKESTPASNRKIETSTTPKTPITYARADQQKARRTVSDEKRKADKAKAAEEEKEREAAKARENAQKLADSNAKEAEKQGRLVASRSKREAALNEKAQAKRLLQKLKALPEDKSHESSSPSEPNVGVDLHRRSMTPAIPRSSAMKSSSAGRENLLSSSPLASRSARNGDTPLRDSAVRRSVSFMNDPEPTLPTPLPAVISRRPVKTLIEINEELADKEPADVSRPASARNASTKTAAKAKVQTKLNVTRDKKMKGRNIEPPLPTKPVLDQPTVQSSSKDDDVESVSFSDEDPNKAGPSSKKSSSRGSSASGKSLATPVSALSNLDPALQEIKAENGRATPSVSISSLSSRPTTSSQGKSTSRSPAHATSDSRSQTSDSSSNSESESGAVSESDGESSEGSSRNSNNITPHVIKVEVPSTTPELKHDSRKSGKPVSPVTNSDQALITGSAKGVGQAADMQLKRECRESIAEDVKLATTSNERPAKKKFPPLNRHGRLPDNTRPAYYRYPKLSEYEMSEPDEPSQAPLKHVERQSTDESESSSDESIDGSDNDNDIHGKTKPRGWFPGMKGVLKLARSIGSAREE